MRCSPQVVLVALLSFQGLRELGGPGVLAASFIGFCVLKTLPTSSLCSDPAWA